MAWSLSTDDDGLEGISSSQSHSIPLPDAGSQRRAGFVPPRGPDAGPSIVVEPDFPVAPMATPAHVQRQRRALEPTLVLKTRRLDELRDEVQKRRVSHHRKKLKALILWGVAGGLALWLGVVAARTAFAPAAEEETATESEALSPEVAGRVEGVAPPTQAGAQKSEEASPQTKSASSTQTAGAARGPGTKPGADVLTLDDLPTE
jgi:hypothetical protein